MFLSVVSVYEDLAHDCLYMYLQHNKHSRYILGLHGFVSLTVRLSIGTIGIYIGTMHFD